MRVDRSHFPWLIGTLVITALAGLLYLANYHPQKLPFALPLPAFFGEVPPTKRSVGGTPLGLALGIASYAIFLFAAALGIRKKRRTWPIGNVKLWLKAHVWLSTLTIPLVLFHAGFRLGGTLTTGVMLLYGIVMVSGFLGIALQQVMPRLMKDLLPREVVFEQIPFLRGQLFESVIRFRQELRKLEEPQAVAGGAAARVPDVEAADASVAALVRFLEEHAMPYLAAGRGDRLPLGDAGRAAGLFRSAKLNVAAEWHPRLDEVEAWCAERRAMDLQTRLQHWLHGWLVVHVPVSFALIVFTAWHAWAGFMYSR